VGDERGMQGMRRDSECQDSRPETSGFLDAPHVAPLVYVLLNAQMFVCLWQYVWMIRQ